MRVNFDNITQSGWFVDRLPDEMGVGVVWSARSWSALFCVLGLIIAAPLLAYGFFQHDFQPSNGFRRAPDQGAMVVFLLGYVLVLVSLVWWPRYLPAAIEFGPDRRIITPEVTYTVLDTKSGWIYISLMVFCVAVAGTLLTRTPTGAVVLMHVLNIAAFAFFLAVYLNIDGWAEYERKLVEHAGDWQRIVAIESEPASQWGWSAPKDMERMEPPLDVFMMFENGRRLLVVRTDAGREFATMLVLSLKEAHSRAMNEQFSAASVLKWTKTMGVKSASASPSIFEDGSVGFEDGPKFS